VAGSQSGSAGLGRQALGVAILFRIELRHSDPGPAQWSNPGLRTTIGGGHPALCEQTWPANTVQQPAPRTC
jgi:hypothetical protein